MKIERLTDNKIRIIMDPEELDRKNIDFLELTQNTEASQKLFKKILKQAEKEVGFEAEDSKLLIEAFISAEGFFVLTFTKLSPKENAQIGTPLKLKVKRKLPSSFRSLIYEFASFDEFCNFCTYSENSKLKNIDGFAKRILFYEYKSKYFLVFSDINKKFEHISLFYASISEFAELVSDCDAFYGRLIEYGNVIFKGNAIKNGIKYFSK